MGVSGIEHLWKHGHFTLVSKWALSASESVNFHLLVPQSPTSIVGIIIFPCSLLLFVLSIVISSAQGLSQMFAQHFAQWNSSLAWCLSINKYKMNKYNNNKEEVKEVRILKWVILRFGLAISWWLLLFSGVLFFKCQKQMFEKDSRWWLLNYFDTAHFLPLKNDH